MQTVAECIDFVKLQIEYQDRRATINRSDPKKLKFHIEKAAQFRSLLQFLETLRDNPSSISQVSKDIDHIGTLQPKELVGLPQELLDELSGKGADKQELLITELIENAGGVLSLDRILIGIYKATGEVIKRPVLTAKLYRMVQGGAIRKIPGKKSLYTTSNYTTLEALGEAP